ncbi:TRAFAC clade GTPase domain-containing protein [Parafrankia sp. FMc2]|uniref:TRAFAC clade GTPase domain-containing protein n=1 Tax=Parafrankia sp. FMc2 TaxID=3233196 RepID=UPI0034D59D41
MLAFAGAAMYISFVFLAPLGFFAAAAWAGLMYLAECATATNSAFRGTGGLERIKILPPPPEPPDSQQREPAYRSYYFGPVFYEYSYIVENAFKQGYRRVFGAVTPSQPGRPGPQRSLVNQLRGTRRLAGNSMILRLFGTGPYLAAFVGLAVGFGAACAFTLAVSAAYLIVLAVTVAGSLVVAGLMRTFEQISLWARGITLECQKCHRRVTAPAYACALCPPHSVAIHKRLVPGSLGIFQRLCRCGNTLPTLLTGGKWRLTAYCNHCKEQLPRKGMTAPTFHVPVVAGRRAGKTIFMMSAIAYLERRSLQSDDSSFEFADQAAMDEFGRARQALSSQRLSSISATDRAAPVRAYNVYLGPEKSSDRRLLYFYDPAGEKYEQHGIRGGLTNFHFLGHTGGIVLVVDPFSFAEVRDGADTSTLALARPSTADPEDVFQRFVQSFRAHLDLPVDRRARIPLAVVLTKSDALLGLRDCAHPYDKLTGHVDAAAERGDRSAAVRQWLVGVVGQRSLVTTIEGAFEQVGYFAVSGLDAFDLASRRSARSGDDIINDAPSAPVAWLIDAAGRGTKPMSRGRH